MIELPFKSKIEYRISLFLFSLFILNLCIFDYDSYIPFFAPETFLWYIVRNAFFLLTYFLLVTYFLSNMFPKYSKMALSFVSFFISISGDQLLKVRKADLTIVCGTLVFTFLAIQFYILNKKFIASWSPFVICNLTLVFTVITCLLLYFIPNNGASKLSFGEISTLYNLSKSSGILYLWGAIQTIRESFSLFITAETKQYSTRRFTGSFVCLYLTLCLIVGLSIFPGMLQYLWGPFLCIGFVSLFYTNKKVISGIFTIAIYFLLNQFTKVTFDWKISAIFTVLFCASYLPAKGIRKYVSTYCFLLFCCFMWLKESRNNMDIDKQSFATMSQKYSEVITFINKYPVTKDFYILNASDEQQLVSIDFFERVLPGRQIHYVDSEQDLLEQNNIESWVLVENSEGDLTPMCANYYWIPMTTSLGSDCAISYKVFIPSQSTLVSQLVNDGIDFYNDGESLILTRSNTYSINAEDCIDWQSNGETGYLAYGPYLTLPAGKYIFYGEFTIENSVEDAFMKMDVVNPDKLFVESISDFSHYSESNKHFQSSVSFTLTQETSNLEFRILTSGGGTILQVDYLQIAKIE